MNDMNMWNANISIDGTEMSSDCWEKLPATD
jgi:hypothetical protein